MSIYEQNIVDFIYVLENQPNLLTPEDSLSLEDLLKTLPDDLEEISNKITLWYDQRQTIKKAIFELPEYSHDRDPI